MNKAQTADVHVILSRCSRNWLTFNVVPILKVIDLHN